jgi:hypothetical protein
MEPHECALDNPLNNPDDILHGCAVKVFNKSRKPIPYNHISFQHRQSTYSKILDNLWIGGAPPPQANIGQYFDCLVLCAHEYQPDCFPDIQVAFAPMRDDGLLISHNDALQAVKAAGKTIKWMDQGLKVLVTCYAGRNRSGLVTALTLCKGPMAMPPVKAIAKIKSVRGPDALSNLGFVRFIMSFCRAVST